MISRRKVLDLENKLRGSKILWKILSDLNLSLILAVDDSKRAREERALAAERRMKALKNEASRQCEHFFPLSYLTLLKNQASSSTSHPRKEEEQAFIWCV